MKSIKNISDFHLKFDIQGLSAKQKAEAAIYFNYKDTLVKTRIPIESNSHYSISKPSLPDSLLNGISGYIHLKNNTSSGNVLIHNISYIDSVAVVRHKDGLSTRQPNRSTDNIRKESLGRPEPN